jgi:hypothetical protein
MIILAELSPLDTVAGARKLLRASSANDPAVTGLNDVIWRPAITEEAEIGIRLFKGDFDGQAAPSTGSLSIQIDQWLSIEPNARRFLWQGAPVKLYAGVSGQAWPWAVVFEGLVDQFSAGANTVKLNLKVNTEPFDADVLTLKYAGTGGAEGDANLKDKVKPFLLGRKFNVEPVLINAVDNVLQFSGYGEIQAVTALFERGSAFGASSGNYATYAALVAATIAPGHWATCLAQGMVRLGAPPYSVITGDVDGDKAGGTWRRKTGEIIQRIASNSGVSGSLIESASFTALDTALAGLPNQGRMGVFIDSQISVLEIAAKLAAPCNAQVGVSLAGKMFVGRVTIGSPTITLDAQQRQLPRVISSSEVSVSPPFSYIEMGYAQSERVHTDQEIAGIDTLLNVRFPSPPPEAMLKGGSYFDATNKQYIYDDPVVTTAEGPVTTAEGVVTTSGYADVQDLAIPQALADAAAAEAAALAALAAASIAQNLATDAAAIADGKVQTFYQPNAPLDASEGDIWIDTDGGNNQYRYTSGAWVDVQDTGIGQAIADAAGAQATADGKVTTYVNETAPTAEALGDLWFKQSTGELRRWSGSAWGDPLVDLTAAKQVVIVPPLPQTVYRTWQGVIKTSQYPRTLTPQVEQGGVDIRTRNDVSYAITTSGSIAATVNNTNGSADKGRITATNGSNGSIVLTVSIGGLSQPPFTIPFTNVDDNPPTTGGTNGGSDSTLEDVTSTSFAPITQQDAGESVFLIDITAGQTINGIAPLNYNKSGTNTTPTAMLARWQYRLQGSGTWLDFVSGPTNVTGTDAFWNNTESEPVLADINANQSVSGLATGTYECQLIAAKSNTAAGNLRIVFGMATVTRSAEPIM